MTDAKDKAVRFRACQTISKLLNALGDDAEIDDDVWELLQDIMIKRTQDKIPVVRVEAIKALARLQDARDAECPIIQAYVSRMESDASPGAVNFAAFLSLQPIDVRKAALLQCALSKLTISHVLLRTRDIKDSVRAAVYKVLQDKLDFRALSIEDRCKILQDGLGDRSGIIRSFSHLL